MMVNNCSGELVYLVLVILVLLYGIIVLLVFIGNVVFFWVIYKVCNVRILLYLLLSLLVFVDFLVGLIIDLVWIVCCVLIFYLYNYLFKIVIDVFWI